MKNDSFLYPVAIAEQVLMGSIRQSNIKRIAEEFVEMHGDAFNEDFYNNKQIVKSSISGVSKKTMNLIAGYITRNVKKQKARLSREIEESAPA